MKDRNEILDSLSEFGFTPDNIRRGVGYWLVGWAINSNRRGKRPGIIGNIVTGFIACTLASIILFMIPIGIALFVLFVLPVL